MSEELFPSSEISVDSPRLAWIKLHGVETEKLENAGDEDDDGYTIPQWVCRVIYVKGLLYKPRQIACGETEDEALAEYALKNGLQLWNETT